MENRIKEPKPCSHPGCLHHLTHPCEGCGRTGGFYLNFDDRIKELKVKGYELVRRFKNAAVMKHSEIWVVVSRKKKITCMGENHADRVAQMMREWN